MDLSLDPTDICNEKLESDIKILKRKLNEGTELESYKKVKHDDVLKTSVTKNETITKGSHNYEEPNTPSSSTKVPSSPKKRLEIDKPSNSIKQHKEKFIYGNYSQYYRYRNEDHHDIRLDVFIEHKDIFKNKCILDIGCNNGFITMEVAKQFEVQSIVGLDIDKSLIKQAVKNLTKIKKSFPFDNELKKLHKFPFNISFVHGNYVLKDDVLLEIEKDQFDVILCLSITKWIHLNFGDKGLKQAFKRIFLQLRPQGKLILEAQPFDNYGRRKKMTETIFENYKNIKFLPRNFTEYLLSNEVGFSKMELMGVPDHCKRGFKRPIQIFFKS